MAPSRRIVFAIRQNPQNPFASQHTTGILLTYARITDADEEFTSNLERASF